MRVQRCSTVHVINPALLGHGCMCGTVHDSCSNKLRQGRQGCAALHVVSRCGRFIPASKCRASVSAIRGTFNCEHYAIPVASVPRAGMCCAYQHQQQAQQIYPCTAHAALTEVCGQPTTAFKDIQVCSDTGTAVKVASGLSPRPGPCLHILLLMVLRGGESTSCHAQHVCMCCMWLHTGSPLYQTSNSHQRVSSLSCAVCRQTTVAVQARRQQGWNNRSRGSSGSRSPDVFRFKFNQVDVSLAEDQLWQLAVPFAVLFGLAIFIGRCRVLLAPL